MDDKAGVAEAETQSGRWDADEPSVYFLVATDRPMVKIGKSVSVETRTKDIARMNAGPLKVLATVRGYSRVEKWMHRRWHHLHDHNEWFRLDAELLTFIEQAAKNRNITMRVCRAAVRMDEPDIRPSPVRSEPIRTKVGDQFAILAAWRAYGGHDVNEGMIELNWPSLSGWNQHRLQDVDGVWCTRERGTPVEFQHVGYARVANQLVDFADDDHRQLAFIYAAMRDAENEKRLHGPFIGSLWDRVKHRVGLDGRVRHWMPTEPPRHENCECREKWYDSSARSELEWLQRLAHLSTMEPYVLGKIVNGNRLYDQWRSRRAETPPPQGKSE